MSEPVLVLEPPYEACRAPDDRPPALGAILVGDLTGEEPAAVETAAAVVRLQAEAPWCPVCLVIGPHVTNGPVIEALDPLDGSVAWVVRTAGGFQPDPATVVEAVQARPAPDASQVSDYFRRRTGADDPRGEQLAEQIAARLETSGERVGWEWMVETEVRGRKAGSVAV
jgi:hypothetical protein